MRAGYALFVVAAAVSCTPRRSLNLGAECAKTADCVAGLCINNRCTLQECKTDTDCKLGACIESICSAAAGETVLPEITDVRGATSSGRVGADNRIVITGSSFGTNAL